MLGKLAAKLVSTALMCATLTLGASSALAQPAPTQVTLTLGSDGYHYLLHYITEGAGLYKAEGLTVEIVRFTSGSKIIASVLGGSADASMVNVGNSTLAIEKGGDIATLMTLYTIMPFAVVLSNDALKKTGIMPAMPLVRTGENAPGRSRFHSRMSAGTAAPSSWHDAAHASPTGPAPATYTVDPVPTPAVTAPW